MEEDVGGGEGGWRRGREEGEEVEEEDERGMMPEVGLTGGRGLGRRQGKGDGEEGEGDSGWWVRGKRMCGKGNVET